ncbi:MAG: L,D-transpeptidase [Clostridia bacterium]|nr:L,D-transpeptidase [Clostridia bacterium]
MKIYLKIIIALILTIIILCFIVYGVSNKKIETNITIDEIEIYSGEELNQNKEIITYHSGENNFSGEYQESISEEDSQVQKEVNEESKDTLAQSSIPKQLSSTTPFYIKINNSQNVVTIYSKDSEGNYTVPYKAMICSIGDATPAAGKMYKVTSYKKRWNALQGNVYGQYATQIVGNILFHSVPYTAKSNSALEYWEYDKLGTAASLGCVRLTVEDAKWIYDNIVQGTIVEFYEDANPGPLR